MIGASSRTPFKHALLRAELGRIVGALCYGAAKLPCKPPFFGIDLCAGDGAVTDYSSQSSPAIFAMQVPLLCKRKVGFHLYFIEKNPHSHRKLLQNLEIPHSTIINDDARNYDLSEMKKRYPLSPCFVHCDPNHIHEMPMSEDFIQSMPMYTTYLVTLGCNVGGIKRLSREKRDEWFQYLERLIATLTARHDLLIVELLNDTSQWAYVLRLPSVWSKGTQARIEKIGGIAVFSFRRERGLFGACLDRLFLTKKERS